MLTENRARKCVLDAAQMSEARYNGSNLMGSKTKRRPGGVNTERPL